MCDPKLMIVKQVVLWLASVGLCSHRGSSVEAASVSVSWGRGGVHFPHLGSRASSTCHSPVNRQQAAVWVAAAGGPTL